MVNRAIRFLSLLILTICTATFSSPTNSTSATINRVEDDNMALSDCYKTARNVSTFLGSIVLTETLFCCYVLYSWARNFRINSQKKIKSHSPNEDVNGDPMYTDTDEGTAQDQNQHTTLRNYQPLDPSSPSGPIRKEEYQPLAKNRQKLGKKPVKPVKQFVAKILAKPNTTQAIKNAAFTVNEDVGGLVYSQPYEDSVSSASQLKMKGTGSFRGKTNKNPPQEEENKIAFYHVLEEDPRNKSPIEQPIPFEAPEDQNREDVYYYCDSDNPENRKVAPSKAIPTKPFLSGYSKEPEDEVYYSCTLEESNKLSRTNSNKVFSQMVKEKSSKANLSVQQPYYHVLDNQSESAKLEPTIKSPLNPLKTNPMINAHVIEEMKNRVANKKYGD